MARKTTTPPPRLPRLRNISPLGALDVPALGRTVHADEVFEARDDIIDLLAEQIEHFEPTNDDPFVPGNETSEGETDVNAA